MRWLVGLVVLVLGCSIDRSIGEAIDTQTESAGDSETGETGETGDATGETGECTPDDVDECSICEAAHCCSESQVCALDPECPCIVDCLLDGHSLMACNDLCGLDAGEHEGLFHCLSMECASVCLP